MELKHGGISTLMGSMPLKDASVAAAEVLNAGVDIPAWPQLPKMSYLELMMPQYAEGLPCIVFDSNKNRVYFDTTCNRAEALNDFYELFFAGDPEKFAISEKAASGFYAFLDELEKRSAKGEKWEYLKGQVTGPFTFGFGIHDQTGKPAFYDGDLLDVIIKNLAMKARWQAAHLKKYCGQVVIFVDEPILTAFGSSAYIGLTRESVMGRLNELTAMLHEDDIIVGVHCCGGTDWSMFFDSDIDIVNFDAYQFAETVSLYPKNMQAYLERGGVLAWGIVPTNEKISSETPESLYKKLEQHMNALVAKGVDSVLLKKQAILSPSCGTGSLTEEKSLEVAAKLVAVSGIYKKQIG